MEFIQQHVYLFLLLLTITEGPITSFVSAWLAAQGILNIRYVVGITLLGDLIADVLRYVVGRFFYKIRFVQTIYNSTIQKKTIFSKLFARSPFLYFVLVKITPYLAMPSLISLGMKKMDFLSFLKYSFLVSCLVKIVYLGVGYFASFGISQVTQFLNGWKQIVIYVFWGILLFWGIKQGYFFLSRVLQKKLKSEKIG
jgi:membrane protein DedA with SNARE-associated domain